MNLARAQRVFRNGKLCALMAIALVGAARADTAPPAAGQLEQIVVTAQFRKEKLQTTPIAITALTANTIVERGLTNVTDIGAQVPSTIIQPLGAGWGATMAAFIRGVGLGDNILSFEPGVPIYVDGVYIGRPQGAMFDLLDLQRVEVLRGPQGTLFGKNAIGGTIRLISKKPQGDNTGSMSVTIGNFGRLDARGSYDISLIKDRVFARFAFSSKKADGWFHILDYVCVHGPNSLGTGGPGLPNGPYGVPGGYPGGLPGIHLTSAVGPGGNCQVGTLNNENIQSGRAAFRILTSSNSELNIIADLESQRQEGPADKYTVIDGNNGLNQFWNSAFVAPVYGAGVAWDSRFVTNSMYTNYSSFNDPLAGRSVPNINNMDHWGVSAAFDWDISDNMHFKSITAYRRFWNTFGRDSDGSPLPNNFTYDDSRHRQFTQELRLTGKAGKLDWATGAFYYDAYDSNRGFDVLYPTVIYQHDSYDTQTTKNWAIFTQETEHFTDKFSLTGGVRYTHDEKNALINLTDFFGGVIINNDYVPLTATNTDFTVAADYQWTQNLMTYLKYATGFKGGGFSARPADALQTAPFKPEKLRTWELGEKSEFLDHRLRLNTDVYFSRYLDQQTFTQTTDALGVNWFRYTNAGKAKIWGIEAEVLAEPIDRLQINLSSGYLNYDLYDRESNTLLLINNECGGQRCYSQRTPELTATAGMQYGILVPGGSLTPRLDAQYQSRIYFTSNNQGEQGGYTLLNGRLTWETESKDWDIALYGRNLTNKEYFAGKLSLVGFFGREQGNPGTPREWGLTFERNFH